MTSTVTVRCSVQFYFHNSTHLACASLCNQIRLKFGPTTLPWDQTASNTKWRIVPCNSYNLYYFAECQSFCLPWSDTESVRKAQAEGEVIPLSVSHHQQQQPAEDSLVGRPQAILSMRNVKLLITLFSKLSERKGKEIRKWGCTLAEILAFQVVSISFVTT